MFIAYTRILGDEHRSIAAETRGAAAQNLFSAHPHLKHTFTSVAVFDGKAWNPDYRDNIELISREAIGA